MHYEINLTWGPTLSWLGLAWAALVRLGLGAEAEGWAPILGAGCDVDAAVVTEGAAVVGGEVAAAEVAEPAAVAGPGSLVSGGDETVLAGGEGSPTLEEPETGSWDAELAEGGGSWSATSFFVSCTSFSSPFSCSPLTISFTWFKFSTTFSMPSTPLYPAQDFVLFLEELIVRRLGHKLDKTNFVTWSYRKKRVY